MFINDTHVQERLVDCIARTSTWILHVSNTTEIIKLHLGEHTSRLTTERGQTSIRVQRPPSVQDDEQVEVWAQEPRRSHTSKNAPVAE